MGEVYKAWDERLARWVAVKHLRTPGAAARTRFRREAQAAAQLGHPSIVRIFDIQETDDGDWIVMELVDGPTLAEVLREGPLEVGLVVEYGLQVASGLVAAHSAGIVHRDLKTENVILQSDRTSAGRAKILDFGLARFRAPVLRGTKLEPEDVASLTAAGQIMGTPRAMSPEQARGHEIDTRSDLFSFGVLLYEILSAESPFRGRTAADTLVRVITHKPSPLRNLDPRIPPALSDLVDHLLEKEPPHRPQDAVQVVEALKSLARAPLQPVPTSLFESTLGQTPAAAGREHQAGSGASKSVNASSCDPSTGPTEVSKPPRRLAPALAALGISTAVFFGMWNFERISRDTLKARGPVERRTVAVLPVAVLPPMVPENADSEDVEMLAYALRNALMQALTYFEELSPKAASEVDAVSGPPTAVARSVGADDLLESSLACQVRDCFLELRRVRGVDGGVERGYHLKVPLDDLLTAARAVGAGLRQLYPDERLRPGHGELEVAPEDYTIYVEVLRSFEARPESRRIPALFGQLERLRQRAPRFVEILLLEARVAFFGWTQTHEDTLLERTFDRLVDAQEIRPKDPSVLFLRCYVEIQAGRLAEAEQTLAALESLVPGDDHLLDTRAQLLKRRGMAAQALELAGRALERRPSWRRLFYHASLAKEQGDVAAARKSLEQLLDLHPDHVRGTSLLAELELVSGDPRHAAALYADLVARAPAPRRYSNLGIAYMLVHDYAASASAFERAHLEAPKKPGYLLNLADALWLGGRTEEAEELYRQVKDLVPEDTGDPWELVRLAQARAHLGEHREAVNAVRTARRMAPEDNSVAYESALVYAIVGDPTAAVANAARAVELGLSPCWFTLPWFDELRTRDDFQEAVTADTEIR